MNYEQPAPPVAASTESTQQVAPQPAAPQEPTPESPAEQPTSTPEDPQAVQKESATTVVRTWTDKTGKFSTEARFGGMASGSVALHKTDGATVKISFDQLSQADQDWIEARRRNATTKASP